MPRQFRSDDTSKWLEGFGNGEAGNATLSGTYGAGNGGYIGSATGTSGSYSLTTQNGWGNNYGGWVCLIHQSRGTGAGNWELNRIVSISGTTSTMKYPLQNNYTSPAQCILALPYNDITISGTLTAPSWNGSVGGVVVLLAKTSITVAGSINVVSKGYRGGAGAGSGNPAQAGEGTGGAATNQTAANGNSGGGADGGSVSNGGGGGGNGAAGNGGIYGDGNNGKGGAAAGNAGLTVMVFGGAGGGGSSSNATGSVSPTGATGAGIVVLIAPTITVTGTINLNGAAGTNGTTNGWVGMGHSGASAGGSALFKGMTVTLGSNLVTANSALGGISGGNGERGGNSAVGRIHVDYSGSISGTTSPTLSSRQDSSIVTPQGATGNFFAFM